MRIGCVLMASGQGKRFGSNKLVAPLAGKPLIEHVLEQLPLEVFEKIVVVTRNREVAAICKKANLETILHTEPRRSDTVRLGIQAMQEMDGCLFCLGDQPLCSKESMLRLIEVFQRNPRWIVRLFWQNQPGNPVLFPKHLFENLASLPPGNGGSYVIQNNLEILLPVEAAGAWELQDVDTPEQLHKLEFFLRNSDILE